MDKLAKRRPKKRTAIFDENGMIDETLLAEYLDELREMAKAHAEDAIPQADFMAMLERKDALDSLTRKQWGSYFRLLERAGRAQVIKPEDFEGLYRNTLIPEMFEKLEGN